MKSGVKYNHFAELALPVLADIRNHYNTFYNAQKGISLCICKDMFSKPCLLKKCYSLVGNKANFYALSVSVIHGTECEKESKLPKILCVGDKVDSI